MVNRAHIGLLLLLACAARGVAAEDTKAAREYRKLIAEYDEQGGARTFAGRMLALAKAHPQDSAAVDALLWVVRKVRGRKQTDEALRLLHEKHVQSPALEKGARLIARSRSALAEPLLRTLVKRSPHTPVRAAAAFYLAGLLDLEANLVSQLKAEPELAPRVLQYYGKEYGKHLSGLKPAQLEKKREAAYETVLLTFPDAVISDVKLGEVARQKLFAIRHLSVGKVAPDIQGKDLDGKPFKLSDYRGRVVMLTFWGDW